MFFHEHSAASLDFDTRGQIPHDVPFELQGFDVLREQSLKLICCPREVCPAIYGFKISTPIRSHYLLRCRDG
jgi:hypothetical protein